MGRPKRHWIEALKSSLEKMDAQLEARGNRPLTRQAYVSCVNRFVHRVERHPAEITAAQVEEYFIHLTRERGFSASTRNQYAAALRFYFETTLGRRNLCQKVVRARTARPLPTVLSGSEVMQVLASLDSPVHRTLAMLCYGAGLRVGEACRLKVDDIDSQRMVLHVRAAKGDKDRQVALGATLLEALRSYWRWRRPRGPYLFPGNRRQPPYLSKAAFQKVLKASVEASGLDKRVTPHTLRHCYATHLIEAGTDLRTVQLLLGHSSLRSTMLYVHLTHARMQKVASPLDMLKGKEGRRFG
jgi:site-specific recombinase XerD